MAMTKEERREYDRKYRLENAEKIKTHNARYYSENTEKIKTANVKYRAANPEKCKAYRAKWRENNPEKVKAKNDKYTTELKDAYIKAMLRQQGFKNEQITPELIELKRITLKTTRLCRQLKN